MSGRARRAQSRQLGFALVFAAALAQACSESDGERAQTTPTEDGAAGAAGALGDSASDAAVDRSADDAAQDVSPDGATADTGASCDAGAEPTPTGRTIEVTPSMTLGSALGDAVAGDRIVLHAGTYPAEQIADRQFTDYVFVEAAAGESVILSGASFRSCAKIAFRDLQFNGTVQLDGSSDFMFHEVTFDAGQSTEAALHIHGQGTAGASHDVLVADSVLRGGGRTVFVLGRFAPSDQWNHHLTFLNNDVTCGSRVCFQISGGRDMRIEQNRINGTTSSGILTAGATRVEISRNRFVGASGSQAAMQIATPGMEWDNYAGVENMISSAISIANNVVDAWSTAVQLDAARDVAIVFNTVADGTGIRFNHRTPHDQSGAVILDGNQEIRVWNDILPSISLASGESRPAFESNNLVWVSGGAGTSLITDAPAFGSGADYPLSPGSPAVDAALINSETPLVDFEGHLRGSQPDIGARELDSVAPACP
jgi:hypothetical protein